MLLADFGGSAPKEYREKRAELLNSSYRFDDPNFGSLPRSLWERIEPDRAAKARVACSRIDKSGKKRANTERTAYNREGTCQELAAPPRGLRVVSQWLSSFCHTEAAPFAEAFVLTPPENSIRPTPLPIFFRPNIYKAYHLGRSIADR